MSQNGMLGTWNEYRRENDQEPGSGSIPKGRLFSLLVLLFAKSLAERFVAFGLLEEKTLVMKGRPTVDMCQKGACGDAGSFSKGFLQCLEGLLVEAGTIVESPVGRGEGLAAVQTTEAKTVVGLDVAVAMDDLLLTVGTDFEDDWLFDFFFGGWKELFLFCFAHVRSFIKYVDTKDEILTLL